MRYMERGGFHNHRLMRLTLYFTLLFLFGLWLTNFLLYFGKMDLSPSSVVTYYLGSEAEFIPARTYQSMVEVTHFHLPMMAIVVLLLTHLLIFAPFKTPTKVFFIAASFLSAFLNEGAGWLVRFVSPGFAWLKVVTFLSFQALLIFLIGSLALFLLISGSKTREAPAEAGK